MMLIKILDIFTAEAVIYDSTILMEYPGLCNLIQEYICEGSGLIFLQSFKFTCFNKADGSSARVNKILRFFSTLWILFVNLENGM